MVLSSFPDSFARSWSPERFILWQTFFQRVIMRRLFQHHRLLVLLKELKMESMSLTSQLFFLFPFIQFGIAAVSERS